MARDLTADVMCFALGLVTLAACWSGAPPAQSPAPQSVVQQASPMHAPALSAEEPAPVEEADASTPPHGRMVVSQGPCGGMYPIIYFDHNSAVITRQSVKILDDIASGIRCDTDAPAGLTFEFPLVGHAAPGESKPGPLSLARADAVAKELVARGVPADVLVNSGEGATKPTGDSRTEYGRRINRRVDIARVIHGSD